MSTAGSVRPESCSAGSAGSRSALRTGLLRSDCALPRRRPERTYSFRGLPLGFRLREGSMCLRLRDHVAPLRFADSFPGGEAIE